MTHIFISYSKLNIDFARHLRGLLEAEGFAVWMDETQLVPSQKWWPTIVQNIDTCATFVIIMSPEAAESDWVEREILRAERKEKQENKRLIFPILLEGESWSRLAERQYADMSAGVDSALPTRLVKGLEALVPRHSPQPPPPPLPGPLLPEEPPLAVPPAQPPLLDSPRPEGEGQGVRASRRLLLPALGLVALIVAAVVFVLPALNPQTTPTAPAALAPTNTDTPPAIVADSPTLDSAQAAQSTFDAARTATATLWTPTPSLTSTATITPTATTDVQGTIDAQVAALVANEQATAHASGLVPITRNADWTLRYETFDGVEMALVPAGTFEMGSTTAQIDAGFALCQQAADNNATCERSWFEDELIPAQGNLQVMAPFWIDRTEVTRAQYQQCLDAGQCTETTANEYSTEPNQPINRVTWTQAKTYCEWRGARLPTEAEWEYAARGPDGLIFPWGNDFDGTRANHCDSNCGAASWASGYNYVNQENDDGYAVTAPVGSYLNGASWVGALDMSGNVWEWVSTIFDQERFPYPYRSDDGREDNNDTNSNRGLRGGSFYGTAFFLRAPYRLGLGPSFEDYVIGFRCARS